MGFSCNSPSATFVYNAIVGAAMTAGSMAASSLGTALGGSIKAVLGLGADVTVVPEKLMATLTGIAFTNAEYWAEKNVSSATGLLYLDKDSVGSGISIGSAIRSVIVAIFAANAPQGVFGGMLAGGLATGAFSVYRQICATAEK